MDAAERQEIGQTRRRVLVSNRAANMITSLHPFNKRKANATLAAVRSSVLDAANVRKIAGIDNAFVARAGDLRVFFERDGDSVVVTSIIAPD
jgi:hypothetical protein